MVRENDNSHLSDKLRYNYCHVSDNVNEYLKLAANADKQQIQRIKVFNLIHQWHELKSLIKFHVVRPSLRRKIRKAHTVYLNFKKN